MRNSLYHFSLEIPPHLPKYKQVSELVCIAILIKEALLLHSLPLLIFASNTVQHFLQYIHIVTLIKFSKHISFRFFFVFHFLLPFFIFFLLSSHSLPLSLIQFILFSVSTTWYFLFSLFQFFFFLFCFIIISI